MTTSAAIYYLNADFQSSDHAIGLLTALRAEVDHLVIVPSAEDMALDHLVERLGGTVHVASPARQNAAALHAGLIALETNEQAPTRVTFTGSHVFGPICDRPGWLRDIMDQTDDVWAPYWIDTTLTPLYSEAGPDGRIATFDLLVLGPRTLGDDAFRDCVKTLSRLSTLDEIADVMIPLNAFWMANGHTVAFAVNPDGLAVDYPALSQVDRVIRDIGYVFPTSVLTLDPALHDLNAIDLRAGLDHLRSANPALYRIVTAVALAVLPARDFATISDSCEVLPETALDPNKTEWSFGQVGIFVHAYYPHMMPDLLSRAQNVPGAPMLYVTTASDEARDQITSHLSAANWPADRADVRVVEQNRGRDMASLFITFRDVILSDRHKVALRLHSKQTPQVSRQVGEGFKKHLFDNLVPSQDYVSNLLTLIDDNPDIGLVIPPAIHVGFGTLGHAWFNNKDPLTRTGSRIGLNVPLDAHTPLAAFGTMFWFRTAALRPMFEEQWHWDEYNREPHHFDGGLAHVQERLIGLCAQNEGFRTMTVMSPRLAARNYMKLEYKYQLLAAHLTDGIITNQVNELKRRKWSPRARLFDRLKGIYGRLITRHPALRQYLKPVAHRLVWLLR